MVEQMTRHLPLSGTYNVRDLGGYPTSSGALTRWRSVLRADSIHRLDPAGRRDLLEAGLSTVIDLRFPAEKKEAPQPFRVEATVEVIDIALFAKLELGGLRSSPEGDLLLLLYRSALAACGNEIDGVLSAVADAGGMVLFHCTAGKDRTGIVAALLLLAAGVPDETVADDYALTATLARPLFDELLRDMVARGQNPEHAKRYLSADRTTMIATLAHIRDEYGGVAKYLASVGFGPTESARLQTRLVAA